MNSALIAMFAAGGHAHNVPPWQQYLFVGILVLMILTLALEEKLHAKKSVIVGTFAVLCLIIATAMGHLPLGPITNVFGEKLPVPLYITAVDWSVVAIILGSSIFVDVTSRSGLFTWIAIKLTKASKGDPLRLLYFYGGMTVLFSAVLNNVTAMIIVGSLTGVSLKKLGREDKLLGFLLVEGLLTNIGGLLTLISSVPNIIVENAAKISFIRFFLNASPYVVIATIATLILGAKLFKIESLKDDDEKATAQELVQSFDENDGIESRGFFFFGAVMTGLFILVMATTSLLPVIKELKLGFVALTFGLIMLWRYKNDVEQFFAAVDWDLLAFFGSLFIVINVMEHMQVLTLIGVVLKKIIALGPTLGSGALLVTAAAFSSVTDNIPLAAMLSKILTNVPGVSVATATAKESSAWWSVIFGCNLGGNLTPIGSASTLVAVTIIHKYKLKLSFGDFVKKSFPFAVMHIILATIYVLAFL